MSDEEWHQFELQFKERELAKAKAEEANGKQGTRKTRKPWSLNPRLRPKSAAPRFAYLKKKSRGGEGSAGELGFSSSQLTPKPLYSSTNDSASSGGHELREVYKQGEEDWALSALPPQLAAQVQMMARELLVDFKKHKEQLERELERVRGERDHFINKCDELEQKLGFVSSIEQTMGGASQTDLAQMVTELSEAREELKYTKRSVKETQLENLRLRQELTAYQSTHVDCHAVIADLRHQLTYLHDVHKECEPHLERALKEVHSTLLGEVRDLSAAKYDLERKLSRFHLAHTDCERTRILKERAETQLQVEKDKRDKAEAAHRDCDATISALSEELSELKQAHAPCGKQYEELFDQFRVLKENTLDNAALRQDLELLTKQHATLAEEHNRYIKLVPELETKLEVLRNAKQEQVEHTHARLHERAHTPPPLVFLSLTHSQRLRNAHMHTVTHRRHIQAPEHTNTNAYAHTHTHNQLVETIALTCTHTHTHATHTNGWTLKRWWSS